MRNVLISVQPLFAFYQPSLLDDEADNSVDTFTALQIRENEGSISTHSSRICFHNLKVRTYQRSQIDLVYYEKVGARNARSALTRYFFTCRDVDHIDR